MHVYCIDGENTSNKWGYLLKQVEPGDTILLFFSHNCKNISLGFLHAIMATGANFELISCKTGANAMDFQLCTELGFRIGGNPKADYVIVSEDHGYDSVVQYWGGKGISVSRMPILSTAPSRTDPYSKKTLPHPARRGGQPSRAANTLNKVKSRQAAKPEPVAPPRPVPEPKPENKPENKPQPALLPLEDCRKAWKTMLLKARVPAPKVGKIVDAIASAFAKGSKNPRLSVYHAVISDFGKNVGGNLYKGVAPVVTEITTVGPMPTA